LINRIKIDPKNDIIDKVTAIVKQKNLYLAI